MRNGIKSRREEENGGGEETGMTKGGGKVVRGRLCWSLRGCGERQGEKKIDEM